jgi:hypothetical protein
MKGLAILLLCVALAAVFIVGLTTAKYSPGNIILNGDGLAVRDPRLEAQATAVAQAALDSSLARAIERQAQQAEADKARAEALATEAAQPALVARNILIALSTGLGALVLVVGMTLAAVRWANKQATSIYPNAAGMYPVIVTKGWGWAALHDPNRGLGPTAIYKTPTLLDQLAAVVSAIKQGMQPQLPQPEASFPATGSEMTMTQIASQAQGVALMAAVTRPQGIFVQGEIRRAEDSIKLVQAATNVGAGPAERMPQITIVNDPTEVNKMLQLFESEGA